MSICVETLYIEIILVERNYYRVYNIRPKTNLSTLYINHTILYIHIYYHLYLLNIL